MSVATKSTLQAMFHGAVKARATGDVLKIEP